MIDLPASKSIGARYLVASYFANTIGACPKFDDCDDLRVIQKALMALTINEEWLEKGSPSIDIHASGTALRFVTAVAASTPGADFIITGTSRVCSRPMDPMLDVLRKAGAKIEALGDKDCGPYKVLGRRLKGGDFEIQGDVSSQFISALMLCAPTWKGGMRLKFTTPLVSRPYVEMTAEVMRRFGIFVKLTEEEVTVYESDYLAPRKFVVEADWSAAGFFYEAAALMDKSVEIADLVAPEVSLQGDAATVEFFRKLGIASTFLEAGVSIVRDCGAPEELHVDLAHNPDLAPAFAVACALSNCKFKFTGVRNLRLKECDRLVALKTELGKMGFAITVGEDHIAWEGEKISVEPYVIETYDDHRIAMAFAVAALSIGKIMIAHPEVVDKSFSDFWNQLEKLGLLCEQVDDIMSVRKADL